MALGSDDNYKILISTDSDTRGAKATESALDKLRGATDNSHSSFLKMSGAVAVGQAAFALASSAIHKATGFLTDSVKAAGEAEAAQKQLQHAVISVSHATQAQLKETENLADALEKKGVLDGDNIKLGLAQLSTFGLSNKAVQKLGGALSDLAVNQFGVSASGEQLSDTANMIAKALNGQFGILEKSGIRFTQAQKNMIEYGTEMQKVDAINQGFAQNLKYTNDVALTTTEGKMAKLKVSFENVQEAIGASLISAFEPLVAQLSNFVNSDQFQAWVETLTKWFDENLPKAITYVTGTLLPALKNIFDDTWPVIKELGRVAMDVFIWLSDHTYIIVALAAAFVTLKAAMMITNTIQAIGAAFQVMSVTATTSFAVVRTGYATLMAAIAIPIVMPAIAVGAALLAISQVYKAFQDLRYEEQKTSEALSGLNRQMDNQIAKGKLTLEQAYKIQNSAGYVGQKTVGFNNNTYVPQYAAGTVNAASGVALVGENGPELVNFRGGERVTPADKTQKALAGTQNSTTYNIQQVVLQTADAVAEFFKIQDTNSRLISKGLSTIR